MLLNASPRLAAAVLSGNQFSFPHVLRMHLLLLGHRMQRAKDNQEFAARKTRLQEALPEKIGQAPPSKVFFTTHGRVEKSMLLQRCRHATITSKRWLRNHCRHVFTSERVLLTFKNSSIYTFFDLPFFHTICVLPQQNTYRKEENNNNSNLPFLLRVSL